MVTGFRISSNCYLLDRELKSFTQSSRIRPANDRDTLRSDENGWGIESPGQGPDSRIAAGSEIGLENTLKVETRVRTPLGLPTFEFVDLPDRRGDEELEQLHRP